MILTMTQIGMIELTVGERFRSSVCATEVIVLKSPSEPVELACGGARMVAVNEPVEAGGSPDAEFAAGTEVGKRYTDPAGTLEVLCTKSGEGSLTLAGVPLEVKAATALPASD